MNTVKEGIGTEDVKLTGAVEGDYVIRERKRDGELLIVPKRAEWIAADDKAGRVLTPEEWDAFLEQYGSEMLPPDGEG